MNRINDYLPHTTGVIHVGANMGQERDRYNRYDLDVLWFEPIPQLFKKLEENIQPFPKQKAYQNLVTDEDGKEYKFNISSNHGASSSIYELGKNFNDIHPQIHYTDTISLISTTLETVVRQEAVDINKYDALVMDTQGSELLVLKGATSLIPNFKYIRSEASGFELYEKSCLDKELSKFLLSFGFKETFRKTWDWKKYGQMYDIVYENTNISGNT